MFHRDVILLHVNVSRAIPARNVIHGVQIKDGIFIAGRIQIKIHHMLKVGVGGTWPHRFSARRLPGDPRVLFPKQRRGLGFQKRVFERRNARGLGIPVDGLGRIRRATATLRSSGLCSIGRRHRSHAGR
jgi:hypothetical protein